MGFTPGAGGGSSSIAGSTDVALNGPQNNQVLSYESASSKWQNATVAAAGAAGFVTVGLSGSGAQYTVNPSTGAQAAIQQALTSVGIGGAVFLLNGSFSVKSPIVIGDRQAIIGCGPMSTMLEAASDWSGPAIITTPSNNNGVRHVIRDIGIRAHDRAPKGIYLGISSAPSSWGPDPQPWIDRVLVSHTTSDGIHIDGPYSGGQREAKITDCRVEHAGGWAFNSSSSDVFIANCSVQGSRGGYNIDGGNSKVWGCKAYSCGSVGDPMPGFRIGSRGVITGCEAQDNIGNGFEIIGSNTSLSGCVADSNGDGTTASISSGFYVNGDCAHITGTSYQRPGGGATWKIAGAGQMYALNSGQYAERLYARLTTSRTSLPGSEPWVGNQLGTTKTNADIKYT